MEGGGGSGRREGGEKCRGLIVDFVIISLWEGNEGGEGTR